MSNNRKNNSTQALPGCSWCRADENGDHTFYEFNHPTEKGSTASVSFLGGLIAFEIKRENEEDAQRLAVPYEQCPMCGTPPEAKDGSADD